MNALSVHVKDNDFKNSELRWGLKLKDYRKTKNYFDLREVKVVMFDVCVHYKKVDCVSCKLDEHDKFDKDSRVVRVKDISNNSIFNVYESQLTFLGDKTFLTSEVDR